MGTSCECSCVSYSAQEFFSPNLGFISSHGRRSLVGCGPWGRKGLDMTEQLHFHFSFSCIGEGNGNPLQCSCLENSRDGGAWWALIYGVAQIQTRLKWLSSSSSSLSNPVLVTECNLPLLSLFLLHFQSQFPHLKNRDNNSICYYCVVC